MRRGCSIIISIIIFKMVITTAGIMARYNLYNMIAGSSLKSLRWENMLIVLNSLKNKDSCFIDDSRDRGLASGSLIALCLLLTQQG